MNVPFFITGLPQSRTSWLANLFTTGGLFCHHDLLGEVDSVETFCRRMRQDAMDGRVGDSDSGLLAAYGAVNKEFPTSPWVLVTRGFDDAWDSLCAFVASGPWAKQVQCSEELRVRMRNEWAKARLEIIQNPRCLEVYYSQLDNNDTLERVWKHCAPGVRFDARRVKFLQTLSVRPFQDKSPMKPAASLVRELYPEPVGT